MFLPNLVNEYNITPEDILIEETDFLSADLESKRPDVLCKIKTKGAEAFVYILIEHH